MITSHKRAKLREALDPRSEDAISHWDNYYKPSNHRTIDREKYFAELLQLYCPSNSYVVDIACGSSELLTILQERGFHAFGLDINARKFCNKIKNVSQICIIEAAAIPLPFRSNSFECVCAIGFL